MITLNDILTKYVEVRQEFLRLDLDKKEQLFKEFLQTAHLSYKKHAFDVEMTDLFLADYPANPMMLVRLCQKDDDWNNYIGACDRFFYKYVSELPKIVPGLEFVPHSSKFVAIACQHGFEISEWKTTSFSLLKNGALFSVNILFEPHTMILTVPLTQRSPKEIKEVARVLHNLREMIVSENESYPSYRMLFASFSYSVTIEGNQHGKKIDLSKLL